MDVDIRTDQFCSDTRPEESSLCRPFHENRKSSLVDNEALDVGLAADAQTNLLILSRSRQGEVSTSNLPPHSREGSHHHLNLPQLIEMLHPR